MDTNGDLKIFISYRSSDSADVAGRIYDWLIHAFPQENILKDVEAIPIGVDFAEVIGRLIAQFDVVIVVIGSTWSTATRSDGMPQLHDPVDLVRIEVEQALLKNISVVPALVGGAQMPSSEMLPLPLRPLSRRNAISIRPDPDFRRDMERLIQALRRLKAKRETSSALAPLAGLDAPAVAARSSRASPILTAHGLSTPALPEVSEPTVTQAIDYEPRPAELPRLLPVRAAMVPVACQWILGLVVYALYMTRTMREEHAVNVLAFVTIFGGLQLLFVLPHSSGRRLNWRQRGLAAIGPLLMVTVLALALLVRYDDMIPGTGWFEDGLSPEREALKESYRDFYPWYCTIIAILWIAGIARVGYGCWRWPSVRVLKRIPIELTIGSVALGVLAALLPQGGGFLGGFTTDLALLGDIIVFWFAISPSITFLRLRRAMRAEPPAVL